MRQAHQLRHDQAHGLQRQRLREARGARRIGALDRVRQGVQRRVRHHRLGQAFQITRVQQCHAREEAGPRDVHLRARPMVGDDRVGRHLAPRPAGQRHRHDRQRGVPRLREPPKETFPRHPLRRRPGDRLRRVQRRAAADPHHEVAPLPPVHLRARADLLRVRVRPHPVEPRPSHPLRLERARHVSQRARTRRALRARHDQRLLAQRPAPNLAADAPGPGDNLCRKIESHAFHSTSQCATV